MAPLKQLSCQTSARAPSINARYRSWWPSGVSLTSGALRDLCGSQRMRQVGVSEIRRSRRRVSGAVASVDRVWLTEPLLYIANSRPYLSHELAQVLRTDTKLDCPLLSLLRVSETDARLVCALELFLTLRLACCVHQPRVNASKAFPQSVLSRTRLIRPASFSSLPVSQGAARATLSASLVRAPLGRRRPASFPSPCALPVRRRCFETSAVRAAARGDCGQCAIESA